MDYKDGEGMTKKKQLSERIKRFCQEYLIDLNATQSAIRAGYSKKTAKQQGSKLLTRLDVQDYIIKLKGQRLQRVQVSQDYVLEKLVEVAELNSQKQAIIITKEGDINPETGQPTLDSHVVEVHINSDMVHKSAKTIGDHLEMFKHVTKEAPEDDRAPEDIAVSIARQIISERKDKDG